MIDYAIVLDTISTAEDPAATLKAYVQMEREAAVSKGRPHDWYLHTTDCEHLRFVGRECDCAAGKFHEGMRVHKVSGDYRWPGIIDSIFRKQSGEIRIVVESTSPDTLGACHIFNPEQLEPLHG